MYNATAELTILLRFLCTASLQSMYDICSTFIYLFFCRCQCDFLLESSKQLIDIESLTVSLKDYNSE